VTQQDAPDPAISVREATLADTATLVGIVQGAYFEYLGRLDPPSRAHAESPATIQRLLQTEHALIAHVDGHAAGCVFFAPNERSAPPGVREIYLHRLGVLPPWRRRGVGGRLLGAVEAWAEQNGFESVALGVRIAQPENRRYYEARCYRLSAYVAHAGYTRSTAMILRKRIGPRSVAAVELCDWSPAWSDEYERAATQLRRVLSGEMLGIFHVGSTAVRGLVARPTIDLLAVVQSLDGVEQRDERLLLGGWRSLGAAGVPPVRLYRRDGSGGADALLTVARSNHLDVGAWLAFVAYLTSNAEEAAAYGALKRRVVGETQGDPNAYEAAKSDWLGGLSERALQWWRPLPTR
jgi:GrpB-like predicted nucleotidyltransferase (UPF0157 family)/GNAT superfamily N-acetyltransferase